MATWLITGANGWLGGYVLNALVQSIQDGDRIVVLGRTRPQALRGALFVSADLLDAEGLGRAVRDIAPDHVVHAAGKTPPAPDAELYEANFWGTDRLLSALRSTGRPTRVVVTGSSAELGPVAAADLPIREDQPCRPTTAYGRSKMMATSTALANRGPLEVTVARLFNLIGPGMPESLAFGRFAAQLASPIADPIRILAGRLDARRDFVDVRDAARALIVLATRGTAGRVYNVASGTSITIQEGLDRLIALSGRSVRIAPDPGARKPGEVDDSRACVDRIESETGWRAEFSFDQSLRDQWSGAAAEGRLSLPLTA